jgi:asparagine synthase (glutamine-hydrolysing)
LYILTDNFKENQHFKSNIFGFASELKVLSEFTKSYNHNFDIQHFEPGTYSLYSQKYQVMAKWEFNYNKKYHSTGFNINPYTGIDINKEIQHYLISAVKKRVLVTDRPIACLLSGGLDSSLITALVNQIHKEENGPDKKLETYSIGLEGSEDLKYARLVSDYLGTNHTEILLTEQDFIDAIPEVIYTIESYDTTTVRASIGNYLLGKYISQNSDAKVIFNGDGSDELCGGYLYMHKAKNAFEFDYECRRLLSNIYAFDVLRSDKCISSHGLEPRTPFLDRSWVQFYLGIDSKLRFHPGAKQCEKYLLRNAFCSENYSALDGRPLLPNEVIWRRKEAFSDGVSKTTRSLYEIIQEYVKNNIVNSDIEYAHNTPKTDEQKYYRSLFEKYYSGLNNIVPYFWMPRYTNATDASARTLDFYNNPTNDSA